MHEEGGPYRLAGVIRVVVVEIVGLSAGDRFLPQYGTGVGQGRKCVFYMDRWTNGQIDRR